MENIEIKNIEGKGRGLFTTVDLMKDQVLTISPCIPLSIDDITPDSTLWNYVFDYLGKGLLMPQDEVTLMNHDNNPNVDYYLVNETKIKFIVNKDIKAGEELTIDYGYDIQSNYSRSYSDISLLSWNDICSGLAKPNFKIKEYELYEADLGRVRHSKDKVIEFLRRKENGYEVKSGYNNVSIITVKNHKCGYKINFVDKLYSIKKTGLISNGINEPLISMYNNIENNNKSYILMVCFILMKHMRKIYQRPSYYFSEIDFNANIPSKEIADVFNNNKYVTGICMKIASTIDNVTYFKRYPERFQEEYNNTIIPFNLSTFEFKYDRHNHWSMSNDQFKFELNSLKLGEYNNIIIPEPSFM